MTPHRFTCDCCGTVAKASDVHTFHGFLVCTNCKATRGDELAERRRQEDEAIRQRFA
jgi:hypothetical protein